MPSTLTHWRIVTEALRSLPAAEQHVASSTGLKLAACKPNEPGYGVPVLAFLGAIGPDLPYNAGITTRSLLFPTKRERETRGKSRWADLLHYNNSGEFLVELLRRGSQVSSPALRQKTFFYALGHATHIAGDTIMHPFTNMFAGAYHHQSNTTAANNLGIHFYVEFCQDLATDIEYFSANPHALARRPWLHYLVGAHAELTQRHDGVSLLDLLKQTARSVYHQDAAMAEEFGQQLLSGLSGARTLSGLLSWYPLTNPFLRFSPRISTYFRQQAIHGAQGQTPQALTFDQTLAFATAVGGRLCSLIAQYYADITTGSPVDGASYGQLRHDLRDWNLDTGYALDQQWSDGGAGQSVPAVTLRHSWYHFLSLRSGLSADEPVAADRLGAQSR
ncbi:MAG: zinc dependent phospholipase C family protein [Ktedonobacterales bacterium]